MSKTQTLHSELVNRAYAKINLTLEVLGQYSDGYHEIVSVVQAVDLYDTLSFQTSSSITLRCDLPQLQASSNLVFKAANLLQSFAHIRQGALITLEKSIPMDSGLGGGSSDAAATLRALNQLWKLDLPRGTLEKLAAELGSDVVFFLNSNTALMEGRGEKITPLPSFPESWIVLFKPPIYIPHKTQTMYARLDETHYTRGEFSESLVSSIRRGEKKVHSLCYNAFEKVAFSSITGLEEYRQCFIDAGAVSTHLTGAGPTLFTFVESQAIGENICSLLNAGDSYVVRTL
ncbi:MAG: 4-(cytidine 5'-diphospho)-2-C-methyl-D-erythritol kinase [Chloroflexota bacterium]|nr:4-(cytidine 5'-diphospho)-2-C-methyl-D-erythritol kinase [Chloroflexota bacterium]